MQAQEFVDCMTPEGTKQEYSDIDCGDENDAQCCVEYVESIMQYLFAREKLHRPNQDYMQRQCDLHKNMRKLLVDWLCDVCIRFKLLKETLFAAVHYVDSFLSKTAVHRDKLQLVGIVALCIAAKVEEVYAPQLREYVYICDNAYTKQEIIDLEVKMLYILEHRLHPPTPLVFLRRFSKVSQSTSMQHTLSTYLIELSLLDLCMLQHRPSTIAASAVYLSSRMLGKSMHDAWNDKLMHHTRHTLEEIEKCVYALHRLHKDSTTESKKFKAFRRKYESKKLLSVAKILPIEKSKLFL